MTFVKLWSDLQSQLTPGTAIKNWTAAKGYLGDEFTISSVSSLSLEIDSPQAETLQRVSKKDLEFMFKNWEQYSSGKMKRQELVMKTRVSKYTMSIIKHLQG